MQLNLNKLNPAFNLSEGGVFCLQDQLSYELSLFRYNVCVISTKFQKHYKLKRLSCKIAITKLRRTARGTDLFVKENKDGTRDTDHDTTPDNRRFKTGP